jgi:hypothetical protein
VPGTHAAALISINWPDGHLGHAQAMSREHEQQIVRVTETGPQLAERQRTECPATDGRIAALAIVDL